MLDDWRINWELCDLPPEVWDYLKRHKFFAMIIPKSYGGLGFSAYAHSEVIRKLSTCSLATAVTAMVPNSLGPGELLHLFGTKAQQDYWLPRLAAGEEIPCFGLTSPEAGSDAASMLDSGIVCRGRWEGREVVGIKLNWHKRYITLGPVATVLGLAFKLYDPEHLIGDRDEIGITLALVPTNLPGVEIGRRHLPSLLAFQNGPNRGRDVFIPIDHVIGGVEQVGEGWKMLMSALAAGRGISLPSLSAAAGACRRSFHRRLCPHPRAIPRSDRPLRGDPGAARPHGRDRLPARRRAPAHLCRDRPGPPPGGDHGDHEVADDRAHARGRQRRHGRARRQGRAGGSAQLSRPALSRCSDRDHGRGRQHRHPRAHPVRARLDPQPPLSAGRDNRARGQRPRPRPRPVRPRAVEPCRSQRRQRVACCRTRLDRRAARPRTAGGRRQSLLQAARPLRLGVRARRRHGLAHAGRRTQAARDGVRPLRRHSLRALSHVDGAQALGGRGPPASRPAAASLVHGSGLRHHRNAPRRAARKLPQPPGGLAAAARWCCRSGCAAAVRPIG